MTNDQLSGENTGDRINTIKSFCRRQIRLWRKESGVKSYKKKLSVSLSLGVFVVKKRIQNTGDRRRKEKRRIHKGRSYNKKILCVTPFSQ